MKSRTGIPNTQLYHLRQAAKVSQNRIFKEVGIDRVAFRKWEKEGIEPKMTPAQMKKLSKLLRCDLEDIVNGRRKHDY